MSRYGKIPIPLPQGIEVKKSEDKLFVKGPKGELSLPIKKGIEIEIQENKILVLYKDDAETNSATHGLFRSLIYNMVIGVSKGFEKRLSLVGVGYRASVSGHTLDLQLGFSHPTKRSIPKGIHVAVDKASTIIIQGIDKQLVGQFAALVRAIRPPEPYKGKGVRYEKEYVRKKAGKAAKGK